MRSAPPILLLLALVACRQSVPGGAQDAAASATPSPAVTAAPRCTANEGHLTLGDPGPEEDGGHLRRPFAVSLGGAVAHGGGFAAGALRHRGGTHALLALFGAAGGKGRVVELARVHGDPEPPRVASLGAAVLVAVADSDAAGPTLRLALVPTEGAVRWGAELSQGRDESDAFDLAAGRERALVVWDAFDRRASRSRIQLGRVALDDPSVVTPARPASPETHDASVPRVVAREGGFWLSWLAEPAGSEPRRKDHEPHADAGPDEPVVDLGHRALWVQPLDESGAALSEPRAVSARGARVVTYDLTAGPEGSALLAWRDEVGATADTATVLVAQVRRDGSVTRSEIVDDQPGSGAPTLLRGSGAAAWLSIVSVSDRTRVGALSADLGLLDRLEPEAALDGAEPVAADAERWLVARPRGLAVELSTVSCRPGTPRADAGSVDPEE